MNRVLSIRPAVFMALIAGAPVAAMAAPAALTPGSLSQGFGGVLSRQTTAFTPSMRDANGNLVIVNGLLSDPSGLSGGIGASGGTPVQGMGLPVAGQQTSAEAVANQINISAGSWDTIIVNAVQTNSGAIQAAASLNTGTVTNVAH